MAFDEFRSFARSDQELHEFSLTIDHLGLVAAMCDELDIIKIIEQELRNTHFNMEISSGQACLAIILNLLNVLQQPLMLAPEFMEIRPIDRLISRSDLQHIIGEHEITSQHFNQHVLGRTLDRLYEHGLEGLFMTIAGNAYSKFQQFSSRFLHTDTTSMSVHGNYDNDDDQLIQLTYGFSKDGNHNLKQFLISLICCDRLPLFLSTMSGNKSDKKYFKELIIEYGQQIKDQFADEKTFVFDSAYFTSDNIRKTGNEIKWITRVPYTIDEAKQLRDDGGLQFTKCHHNDLQDYRIWSTDIVFAGVNQRWIVVFSKGKMDRDTNAIYKTIDKYEEAMLSSHSARHKLQREEFDTKKKAEQAIKSFDTQLNYHTVSSYSFIEKKKRIDGKKGRIGKNTAFKIVYSVRLSIERDALRIKKYLSTTGRFIVATNHLVSELSDEEVLMGFKSQQNVERGFRFLKDSFFFARSIFLKKPERISALAMLMGISLMVYNLCELKLREALSNSNQLFQDPSLKATEKPSIRRVFQTFMGIHIHYTTWQSEIVKEKVLNIKRWHLQVLELMGEPYMKRYENGIDRVTAMVKSGFCNISDEKSDPG